MDEIPNRSCARKKCVWKIVKEREGESERGCESRNIEIVNCNLNVRLQRIFAMIRDFSPFLMENTLIGFKG